MTKKQKIILAVFLAMFIVPEVLWSPVGNTVYELTQSGNVIPFRHNFLMVSDNLVYFRMVNFIQFIGILSSLIVSLKVKGEKFLNWLFLIILSVVTLVNLCVLYLSFALANISF